MLTFYVDETGFTGEDLLAQDQPIFAQASNNFIADEAREIVQATFNDVQAQELKHSRLIRSPKHRDRIVEFVRVVANDPARIAVWIAHKEFALVTLIVDWWMEPLAHRGGLNLYKDGANLGMANMLYYCLQGFWDTDFRQSMLLHFQRMFRARTKERYKECENFVRTHYEKANGNRAEILRYFWLSFPMLGFPHVQELPKHVLDLGIPGLAFIGHKWRERAEGPWEVVHDKSSAMAKQKWIWDALSSPKLPSARFDNPAGAAIFPMNVSGTRFGDSAKEKQLQICDILAGAASSYLKPLLDRNEERSYRDELARAGIKSLIVGGLWPSTDVTPEELGMKGWDGNTAIEWISKQMAIQKGA